MIRLQRAEEKDRELLFNVNQKYLYEMTNFYDDPMDEKGNYHYGHFEEYFTDPKRKAYFICNDDTLVGFAMLCPYSNIGQNPDYIMAEFTIFPSFRRNHFALRAAKQILEQHPGKWEIKYNEKNGAARKLWTSVTASYRPDVHRMNEHETVLTFRTPDADGPGSVILETERLFLRKMNMEDFDALYAVLGDPNIMQHYPYSFDEKRVREWIKRNMNRYRKDGFGLWAVCLKETGEMIGDCGLTLQDIEGGDVAGNRIPHSERLPTERVCKGSRRGCQRLGVSEYRLSGAVFILQVYECSIHRHGGGNRHAF